VQLSLGDIFSTNIIIFGGVFSNSLTGIVLFTGI
jgi:hypothetical protein